MSSPSRSQLLPPYAMPLHVDVANAAGWRTERLTTSSGRLPFVPPSFVGEVPFAHRGNGAASGEAIEASADTAESAGSLAVVDHRDRHEEHAHGQKQLQQQQDNEQDQDQHGDALDTELPWIEAFGETPAADAADEAADESPETWAIDEAGPSIAHIASDLASVSAPPASAAQLGAHAPWQDDEAWMDIMPTLPNSGSHDPAMDTSWARAFAEPMASITPPPIPAGDTQAAAASLEAIARRLRAGEISVPGFKAESGDAAALAATLSAMLTAQS